MNNKITGVNVSGFFKYQFGIAELARIIVTCLEHAKIPYVINLLDAPHHNLLNTSIPNIKNDNPFSINIIVANLFETNTVINQKGLSYYENKYNIGVWCWETEKFPAVPVNQIKLYNEIWTISNFCKEAISKSVNLPVKTIKLPVILDSNIGLSYEINSSIIDRNKFIILFTFDYLSVIERKNPIATINAFKQAFGNDSNVLLIIKSINENSDNRNLLLNEIKDYDNIILFNKSVSRNEMLSLINTCDIYISLHSSEGLGMGMKEAMALGKTVVATRYSGNLDFMNNDNSVLVDYEKVLIPKSAIPYYDGLTMWANPNVNDASNKLRYLYNNRDYCKQIGESAKKFIQDNFNISICSNDILNKINYLNINRSNDIKKTKKIFDENYYLNLYPDVKNAINNNNFKSGYDHYMIHGIKEGRLCKWL